MKILFILLCAVFYSQSNEVVILGSCTYYSNVLYSIKELEIDFLGAWSCKGHDRNFLFSCQNKDTVQTLFTALRNNFDLKKDYWRRDIIGFIASYCKKNNYQIVRNINTDDSYW